MSLRFSLLSFFDCFDVLVMVSDWFGFLECFDGFFLSFHYSEVGAFTELKHARFCAHKVLICRLH
jgi:hypothetical protein